MSDTKQEVKNHRKNSMILFDDSTIEAEMLLMPKELQEPYRWLKNYIRDECSRDVGVFLPRAKELGITIDVTNWVRVLKGRWKRDADGNELVSPYISATNLLNAITAMREQVRVELLQGGIPFFETSIFHTIRRFIEKKMRKDRVNRFGPIVGPTGLQKSASYNELSLRSPLIKHFESSDNGNLTDFIMTWARKCGASKHATSSEARRTIFEGMMPVNGQIKCAIIDNMQDMIRKDKRLIAVGKSLEIQPAYQFVRRVQDETKCAIIWSLTPESEDQMFDTKSIYLEQFIGRAGGRDGILRLPNNNPKDDLIQIATGLGMKDARSNAELLRNIERKPGRIRYFFDILQDAKDAADDDGEKLTAYYVQAALDERTEPEPSRRAV
ncbi:MAG TPA: hypothetical protein VGO57_09570 [Verrucomicrobiae bacterium]|jgi:hypothetical protein